MDVKQAIAAAKAYLANVYDDRDLQDLELEETAFRSGEWRITLSFPRAAPVFAAGTSALDTLILARARNRRLHKVVITDDDGSVIAMKDRAWLERAE